MVLRRNFATEPIYINELKLERSYDQNKTEHNP